MLRKAVVFLLVPNCILAIAASFGQAGDWPMWRYDAQRSAAAPDDLPDKLSLVWSRQYERRQQVWDDPLNHDLMPYDKVFEPIVVGDQMIFGFNDSDKVISLDVDSGEERWRFYCDGPVRMPPAAWRGKVYFASDDGHLYCLNVDDGALVWKFRGAPSMQKVLGNGRVISMWPARGGPVVADDKVYFAASIWPFLGTFIYALDAETGQVEWVNDGTGSQYIKQPHGAPSFGGVAPQGAFAVAGSSLLVPGGRSVPAVFERATGKLRYYYLEAGGKGTGGSLVMGNEESFFVHTRRREVRRFNLESGKKTAFMVNEPVLTDGELFAATDKSVTAYNADEKIKWQLPVDGSGDLIKVGGRLYAAGAKAITAIDLPDDDGILEEVWSEPVTGQVLRLLAGDDKLFAVTLDGRIMAFGDGARLGDGAQLGDGAVKRIVKKEKPAKSSATMLATADSILKRMPTREGYAFCFGVDDGDLLEALITRSQLHIVAVDEDAAKVARLRQRWDEVGWYGDRITLHVGDPKTFAAPPYIANLVLVGRESGRRYSKPEQAQAIYKSVRPYGGVVCYRRGSGVNESQLRNLVKSVPLINAELRSTPRNIMLVRKGALPGSAPWTHLYGDIANSVKSDDKLVKLPLGILWFGGNSNLDMLPRHGHGPPEQVIGGRLFIQGVNSLSARDVYTGRRLWKHVFDDLGTYEVYYDDTYKVAPLETKYNQVHLPGANLRGTNYVVTEDAVYLVVGRQCILLDPTNGRTQETIDLPATEDGSESDAWSYLGVYDDTLLAGADFSNFTEQLGVKFKTKGKKGKAWSFDRFGSDGLMALHRHTGKKKWELSARHSFLHNGIIAGGGRVYLLDKLPKSVEDQLARRGNDRPETYSLKAVDAATGDVLWEVDDNVFGTWLGYSADHDILIQAGSSAPDRAPDEVGKGIVAYNADDGSVLWENRDLQYAGPCILHNDLVIMNSKSYTTTSGVYSLLTGLPALIDDPLTGRQRSWTYKRAYGCNTAVACENLLTFRSGAAGFYDLERKSGTGNLGGFRSGCSSNLIVADGVLNAPDYTRTCSCGYQNQTSLALVHMPDVEMWTANELDVPVNDMIGHIGINLGAPGDRRDPSGTMWIEYPYVSGDERPLEIDLADSESYRRHTSAVDAAEIPWVLASGLRDFSKLKIRLGPPRPPAPGLEPREHIFDVRLHFAEPDDVKVGERVFDVWIQGDQVLSDFDVVSAAGGKLRGVTRQFSAVKVDNYLTIDLKCGDNKELGPILSGIELISKKSS